MSEQIGFIFSDVLRVNPDERADGSWIDPFFTNAGGLAFVESALALVAELKSEFATYFRSGLQGVTWFSSSVDRATERILGRRVNLSCNADVANAFVAACRRHHGENVDGISYKAREKYFDAIGYASYGIFVSQIGTLQLDRWISGAWRLTFTPYESRFMHNSFQDNLPMAEASEEQWRPSYTGHAIDCKLWEYNIPTAQVRDRRYVITGTFGGKLRHTIGWTFVPQGEWGGPVRSYKEQHEATEKGIVERGDLRGVAVLVNGVRCVIDGACLLKDPGASDAAPAEFHELACAA